MINGVTSEIINAAEKVMNTGEPICFSFRDLLEHFFITKEDISRADTDRIVDWLDDRSLFAVPNLECAPPKAIITIYSKINSSHRDDLFEKLPLSALPCANITREKLPIINGVNLSVNSVAEEILKHNQNAFLIIENQSGNPLGIIDTYSFAKFINDNKIISHISEIIRPIYICAKTTDSLIDTIDKMIATGRHYLIITENEKITGFTSLNGIFTEYYPVTKPFLLITKLESLINQALKIIGFNEFDFESIIPTLERPHRLKGKPATAANLHLDEKIKLINRDLKKILNKFGEKLLSPIEKILQNWKQVNRLRNDIFHFRKTLHISQGDIEILSEAVASFDNIVLILTQSKNKNESST